MTAWNHLPNAKLIDQVLVELKANPEVFLRAWHAVRVAARTSERTTARLPAWAAARAAGCTAAGLAAGVAAWDEARDKEGDAAGRAARDAVLSLVAYDDAHKYLAMSYEKLKIWAELSEEPAAVLLLPYVWAKEQTKELA